MCYINSNYIKSLASLSVVVVVDDIIIVINVCGPTQSTTVRNEVSKKVSEPVVHCQGTVVWRIDGSVFRSVESTQHG